MFMHKIHISIVLLFLAAQGVLGQLSPGPLAEAHKDLEGLSNCLKCHVVGAKVSNEKCLDCHKQLKNRIAKDLGYHSSREVKGKECAECHSDHHGLDFDMIRFDEEAFNHDLTGYELEGAHESVDCKKCHSPDNIHQAEFKKRKNTFLGLDQECLSCHEDYHQNTLDKDCLSCHDMQEFKTAPRFDHADTKFPLRGQHQKVDCRECHAETTKNNKEFQVFAGVEFDHCTSCHEDVHRNTLGQSCVSCHSESSFQRLNKRFDHRRTGFNLQGAHKKLDCAACHTDRKSLTGLFNEYEDIPQNDCVSCHEDIHEGRFGSDCLDCHTVNTFRYKMDPENFDHDLTSFPLLGKHVAVDCRSCHTEDLTAPLAHDECRSCHENHHKNEFSPDFLLKDCAECHQVEGFSPSHFDIDDHDETAFPLKGAHLATPCIFCHQKGENWIYNQLSETCVSCHEDIHKGYLSSAYYPEADCRICHSEKTWDAPNFDHTKTGYELVGAHASVDCRSCHIPDNTDDQLAASPVFTVSSECSSCHSDEHREQFIKSDGAVDCQECHGFQNWEAVYFDHDSTRFKLDGAHLEVDCRECHYQNSDEMGTYTIYTLNTIECSDCH
jgi:hypothetical protein